jgi:hypothetical protein
MSGLEITGVVLGLIPLVIAALDQYADGIRTIKRALKYKTELGNLVHELKAESIIYQDTCEWILDGMVSSMELEMLVKDPGGPLWSNDKLDKQLKERLGRSYEVYKTTVIDMNDAVREFMAKLDLDDQGNVGQKHFLLPVSTRSLMSTV